MITLVRIAEPGRVWIIPRAEVRYVGYDVNPGTQEFVTLSIETTKHSLQIELNKQGSRHDVDESVAVAMRMMSDLVDFDEQEDFVLVTWEWSMNTHSWARIAQTADTPWGSRAECNVERTWQW